MLVGLQTTVHRPIVNSRNEPLCGWQNTAGSPEEAMARLHVIFYDSTLCHVACLLKVGVMQIMLAMIEQEKMNPQLLLDDPVAAVRAWSRDPLLKTRLPLVSGKELTAVELQLLFLEEAKAFVDGGGCEGVVPEAEMIISLWSDTLLKLQAGDFAALTPRLDWLLKLSIIERAMKQRPELTFASAEAKHLDHCYSSLDGGLYHAYERLGAVERIVSEEEIERFVNEPPEDTRAWTRSRLLRIAGPENIDKVDWDEITFRLEGQWPYRRTVRLANPLGFTKAKTHFLETATLDDALDILGAEPAPTYTPAVAPPRPLYSRSYPTHPPTPPGTHETA
jgi:proteasome accessory factor A